MWHHSLANSQYPNSRNDSPTLRIRSSTWVQSWARKQRSGKGCYGPWLSCKPMLRFGIPMQKFGQIYIILGSFFSFQFSYIIGRCPNLWTWWTCVLIMCKLFEEKLVFTTSILYLDFVMIDTCTFRNLLGGTCFRHACFTVSFWIENIDLIRHLTINRGKKYQFTPIWHACRVCMFLDRLMDLIRRDYNVIGLSFSETGGTKNLFIKKNILSS